MVKFGILRLNIRCVDNVYTNAILKVVIEWPKIN